MAITLDSKAGWSGHNSNAPSWSHTIGSGSNRILIVGYTQYCNGDVIPSGNDVTWTASGQSPQALTLLISENLSTWEGVCCHNVWNDIRRPMFRSNLYCTVRPYY